MIKVLNLVDEIFNYYQYVSLRSNQIGAFIKVF